MNKIHLHTIIWFAIIMLSSCSRSNDQLEQDCEKGDVKTCTRIGIHYAFATFGRERDYKKARYYFEKSCNANEGAGCGELGILYEHARGVTQDLTKALELYKKACENKEEFGCYYAGDFYRQGRGVEKDIEKSKEYYKKACALGMQMGCEKE